MGDGDGLQRFVTAQSGGTYEGALAELRAGRKTGHWIWYVLPQLAGLGRSSTAQYYGIRDLDEARAYLADPILGPRLRETARTLTAHAERRPEDVLGDIDAMKTRSSMTLFHLADPDEPAFLSVLQQWWGGNLDEATLRLLGLR